MMVCFIRTPGERNSTGLRFSGDEGGRARAAGASRGAAKTSGGSRVFGPARKYGSMRITCSSSFLLRHWFSKTMMKRWTKVITMMIIMLKLYFSMSRIKFRTHGQRWTEVELFHFRSKPRSAEPGLPFCEETDVDLQRGVDLEVPIGRGLGRNQPGDPDMKVDPKNGVHAFAVCICLSSGEQKHSYSILVSFAKPQESVVWSRIE